MNNDTYTFCWFGHWQLEDTRTHEVRTGWKFWFLPDYQAMNGYGRKPEGFSVSDDYFASVGGVDHFKPMLDTKVHLLLRPYGRRMQFLDCVPVKDK